MEQVEVEITGQAITARYGTLNTGDILRTTAAYAKHLVEEAFCAKYTKVVPTVEQKPEGKAPEGKPARAPKPQKEKATPPAEAPASPPEDAAEEKAADTSAEDGASDATGEADASAA